MTVSLFVTVVKQVAAERKVNLETQVLRSLHALHHIKEIQPISG